MHRDIGCEKESFQKRKKGCSERNTLFFSEKGQDMMGHCRKESGDADLTNGEVN